MLRVALGEYLHSGAVCTVQVDVHMIHVHNTGERKSVHAFTCIQALDKQGVERKRCLLIPLYMTLLLKVQCYVDKRSRFTSVKPSHTDIHFCFVINVQ